MQNLINTCYNIPTYCFHMAIHVVTCSYFIIKNSYYDYYNKYTHQQILTSNYNAHRMNMMTVRHINCGNHLFAYTPQKHINNFFVSRFYNMFQKLRGAIHMRLNIAQICLKYREVVRHANEQNKKHKKIIEIILIKYMTNQPDSICFVGSKNDINKYNIVSYTRNTTLQLYLATIFIVMIHDHLGYCNGNSIDNNTPIDIWFNSLYLHVRYNPQPALINLAIDMGNHIPDTPLNMTLNKISVIMKYCMVHRRLGPFKIYDTDLLPDKIPIDIRNMIFEYICGLKNILYLKDIS